VASAAVKRSRATANPTAAVKSARTTMHPAAAVTTTLGKCGLWRPAERDRRDYYAKEF
jgi:hypothetical protein